MSEFEADEALEEIRSNLTGLFLNLHPNPTSEPHILSYMEEVKAGLETFVEAKFAQLSEGLVRQVETQVKRILQDELVARPPQTSDATTAT